MNKILSLSLLLVSVPAMADIAYHCGSTDVGPAQQSPSPVYSVSIKQDETAEVYAQSESSNRAVKEYNLSLLTQDGRIFGSTSEEGSKVIFTLSENKENGSLDVQSTESGDESEFVSSSRFLCTKIK